MPSISQIKYLNHDGWVLYYLESCRYCKEVKDKVGIFKWMLMNKVECSNKVRPMGVSGYPTWVNMKTGNTWDGGGVFR